MDVTLISISRTALLCLEAVKIFKEKEINVEVIDLMNVQSIDYDTIVKSPEKHTDL